MTPRRPPRRAGALLALLLLAAPAAAQDPPPAAEALSPAQREAVIGLLRETLARDPSILREALQALAEDDRRQAEAARAEAIRERAEALFRDPADPVRGNPAGRVTLVEFFDARCGYCRAMHPAMQELIRRRPELRVVSKDLPILGPNSVLAARALLAAQRQGRYDRLHDALLRLRTEPTEAVVQAEAARAGLDWARLRRDMDDPAISRRLEANLALARELRVEGTPALVIGETLVPGALSLPELERLVDGAAPG